MKFCPLSPAAPARPAVVAPRFRLRLAPGRVAILGLAASAAVVALPLLAPGPLADALPALTASAQAQVPAPIVRSIEIQYAGPATVSRERLLGNMRTTVGQPFTQSAVEDDVRNLYGTGDITNVRIFSEPQADGVKVIVVVQTRSTIRQIDIVGAQKLKARSVKKKLTSKVGGVLNEEIVETDRQKIVTLYQDRGFSDVNVEAKVDINEQAGNAAVTFTVNEGGKSVLDKVIFEGNAHIKTNDLRRAMKGTRGKTIVSFIDKSGRLDDLKLREDLEAIRELYQNKGYIDVEVVKTRTERMPKGGTILYITLNEGTQYRVSNLTFEGNRVFTDANIRRFLKMKEGTLYTPKGLKDDVKTVQDYYGSRGYVDMRVAPDGQPGAVGQVVLKYRIEEGTPSTVEKVNIAGNTVTRDKVIRRELPVAPGDVYNTVLVDASKKRLENLGYFTKVETTPTDTLVPGRKDLDVIVEEKKTGSLSFGAGFSSIDSLIGQVELTQSNFDILNWPSFTGGGQKFRLSLQYGVTRKNFDIGLTEPYFLDRRLAVGGNAFYRETNYSSNDYNQRNIGAAINARRALGRYGAISVEYRVEEITINQVNNSSAILQQEAGTTSRSAVRAGYSFDSRDSVFLTRRGTRIDFSPFITGGPLGGNTQIFGLDLTGSKYFSLPGDTILLFNGEIATVDTYGDGERVPVFDRLYLGGANSLRGYAFRKVGPKDYNGNPVGGRTLVRGTAEYTYPVIARVRGAVFYDIGYVNKNAFDFNPDNREHDRTDFRIDPNRFDNDPKTPRPNPTRDDTKNVLFGGGIAMDFGIGVRLDLPIGPVRLDYGFPLTNDGFNKKSNGSFNFNVGYQF